MVFLACTPVRTAERATPKAKKPGTQGIVAKLVRKKAPPLRFTVILTNRGKKRVTLVKPGDGSPSVLRTPLIGWSARRSGDKRKHLTKPRPWQRRRCGNINPVKNAEILDLAPGKNLKFNTSLYPALVDGAGTYRVVFLYENDPSQQIRGSPLGPHEPGALARIRRSTPCLVVSNEVTVKVVAAD
jgi:hypothetical protein